jgi:hypothetical protein
VNFFLKVKLVLFKDESLGRECEKKQSSIEEATFSALQ